MKTSATTTLIPFFLACNLLFRLAPADEPFIYQTIAVNNQPVPDVPGAVLDEFKFLPQIAGPGVIAVDADIAGPTVDNTNDRVAINGSRNGLSLIYREGDPAPGFPASVQTIDGLTVGIDEAGNSAVYAVLSGPGINGSNNEVVFRTVDGMLEPYIVKGDPAPGLGAGVTIGVLTQFRVGRGGHTAFIPGLAGAGVVGTNDRAIFGEMSNLPVMIAREGDPAPGAGPGVDFDDPLDELCINRFGDVIFRCQLSNATEAVYSHVAGGLSARVFSGHPVPGANPGTTFLSFDDVSFNDATQAAFRAFAIDGAGTQTSGVFSDANGNLQQIAIQGMAAPGALPSQVFGPSFRSLVINGMGETAFTANLTGALVLDSNDSALFCEREGELQMVAREGRAALAIAIRYGNFDLPAILATNAAGNIAFRNELTGSDVDPTNNEALFMTVDGVPQLVAREGDLFDVNDDPLSEDLREINSIFVRLGSGGEDGRRTGLNAAGQLAFELSFSDGSSGVFIATPAFVPGDVDGNGVVNLLDVQPFVEAITTGIYVIAADINQDGSVNLQDVSLFIDLLSG